MILGYAISGPDNDSYLYPEGWGKSVYQVLDFINNREQYITDNFKVKRKSFNLSFTYDSALIVSQKFGDFCIRNEFKGIQFYPLKKQKVRKDSSTLSNGSRNHSKSPQKSKIKNLKSKTKNLKSKIIILLPSLSHPTPKYSGSADLSSSCNFIAVDSFANKRTK